MAQLAQFKPEPLTHVTGLRVWVKELEDLPDAVSGLVETANHQEITPIAILFEFCDGQWHVALFGDN